MTSRLTRNQLAPINRIRETTPGRIARRTTRVLSPMRDMRDIPATQIAESVRQKNSINYNLAQFCKHLNFFKSIFTRIYNRLEQLEELTTGLQHSFNHYAKI
jgi:hypothetical protein